MSVKIILLFLKFISLSKFTRTEIEGKVVGGAYSNITDFPYSASIRISCDGRNSSCGASILNQAILLTAAHCLAKCKKDVSIKAYTGSERKSKGFVSKVSRFKIHENYNNKDKKGHDIALMKLENDLEFGKKIKRVIVMKNPPKSKTGVIAGWGWVDSKGTKSEALKHAKQLVFDRKSCFSKVNNIPIGTICGHEMGGYPAKGDSGSALVIHGAIQIGIVSFKNMKLLNNTIVYTDVPYYYDWIRINAKNLYCNDYEKKKLKKIKTEKKWEMEQWIRIGRKKKEQWIRIGRKKKWEMEQWIGRKGKAEKRTEKLTLNCDCS